MTTLSLRERVRNASSEYKQGIAALHENGRRIYADSVHEERERELRVRRDSELLEVQREAEEAIAEEERKAALRAAVPLAAHLPAEELQKASALLPFARADVAELPTEDLLTRLDAVLEGNRGAELLAYRTAARQHMRDFAQRSGSGDDRSQATATAVAGAVPSAVAERLDALDDALVPSQVRIDAAVAETRLQQLREARESAHWGRFGGVDAVGAHISENYSMPPNAVRAG